MAAQPACPNDLTDGLRLALRLSGHAFDEEVAGLADAAVADMLRAGVSEAYVSEFGPLVRRAVALYCKAGFGYDNADAALFDRSYRQCVTDMLNGPANEAASAQGDAS